ncbi:MAG: NADPH-dependent 7-cyano-7-deazaguanine reductase QueF [Chitinivibrionales bacterium]|nr:NADPH-dependent 7-cyano-7-deazaguanine reductase QueF [Chitinivibrionales bacterium]
MFLLLRFIHYFRIIDKIIQCIRYRSGKPDMHESESILLEDALAAKRLPVLETFACPFDSGGEGGGIIRVIFPEFTCLCPKTGYPDFAAIKVFYLPDKLCIELKSWKLYLNAFRMIGTFHERVTAHIFSTLNDILQPRWLLVAGDFLPRGNVDTTIVFESSSPRPQGADLLIGSLAPHCGGFGV